MEIRTEECGVSVARGLSTNRVFTKGFVIWHKFSANMKSVILIIKR